MLCTESQTFIKLEIDRAPSDIQQQRFKCGEIARDLFGSIWFTCNQCNLPEFSEINEFTAHITVHLEEVVKPEPSQTDDRKTNGFDYADDECDANLNEQQWEQDGDSPIVPQPEIVLVNPSALSTTKRAEHSHDEVDHQVQIKRIRQSTDDDAGGKSTATAADSFEYHQTQKIIDHIEHFRQKRKRKPRPLVRKDMICDYCNVVVGQRRIDVVDHMWTVHTYGIACPTCNRHFKAACNMRSHLRTHSGICPYECKICGTRYSQSMTLTVHMRRHKKEKLCLCSDCGQSFYSNSILSAHWKRVHGTVASGDEPPTLHYCSICGRGYGTGDKLKCHTKKVHGERTYVCDICSMNFKSRSSLVQHMQLHSGGKQYECRYCGLAFAQLAGRRCHEKRQHEKTLVA